MILKFYSKQHFVIMTVRFIYCVFVTMAMVHIDHIEAACFNAISISTDTFNPSFNGTIIGIKLLHVNGSVNCNYNAYNSTNFGCSTAGGGTYYPTSNTTNITTLNSVQITTTFIYTTL